MWSYLGKIQNFVSASILYRTWNLGVELVVVSRLRTLAVTNVLLPRRYRELEMAGTICRYPI